jgi:hypothetical protein
MQSIEKPQQFKMGVFIGVEIIECFVTAGKFG